MRSRFHESLLRAWVKVVDMISRIDFKITGAYYRPSLLGVFMILAAAILFLPLLPLGFIISLAEKRSAPRRAGAGENLRHGQATVK